MPSLLPVVLCTAWLGGVVAKSFPDIDEVDASVSSAVARTMASIEGRHLAADLPAERPLRRGPPLGLSKLSHRAVNVATGHRHLRAKHLVMPKADAPKQLSGYLGWSTSKAATPLKDPSFSTHWNSTGDGSKSSESIYLRDLEQGHVDEPAPKKEEAPRKDQALLSNGAGAVSTAFTKMIEEQTNADEFPSINWGAKKEATQQAKKEESHSGNRYLDSVGWAEPKDVVAPIDNPYLQKLHEDPKKKLLAAAEVVETKSANTNKYFDQLMPNAAYELSLR